LVFTLLGLSIPYEGFAQETEFDANIQEARHGLPIRLVADPDVNLYHVPPPINFIQDRAEAATATINIVYLLGETEIFPGEFYDCYAWPVEAQNSFDYAASIWETLIVSTVPITIDACWTDLDGSILGGSGADSYYSGSSLPQINTWYSVALTNALTGSDQNGSDPEMHHIYNRNFSWYFGTDGNTPGTQYDFTSVVLHEITHGLGFDGSMLVDVSGYGYWGWAQSSYPAIYDRFTENGPGQALLSYSNGSIALGNQLTSEDVYFNGPKANAANGGQRPELYAPGSWTDGSSYSHLGEIFNNTPNTLMTYSLGKGESVHDPGPVTKGILEDIGWQPPVTNTPPGISGLPDQFVPMDLGGNNLIDLWAYASDGQQSSSSLTYTIDNSPASGAGVSIDSNRYIDVNPTPGWTGTTEVRVRVQDNGGLGDTDTFLITVSLIWDGSSGSNWNTAANWTPAVIPNSSHLVTIPPAANQPILSNAAGEVGDLVIKAGAVLDLGVQTLSVEGTLTNQGTLVQTKDVNDGQKTSFLQITDQLGLTNKYVGIELTPEIIAQSQLDQSAVTSVRVSISGDQFCSPLVPGVRRCYDIAPQAALSATVRYYFTQSELDGKTLNQLLVFHLADGSWIRELGPYHYPLIVDSYYVEVENVNQFSKFGLSEYALDQFTYLPLLQK